MKVPLKNQYFNFFFPLFLIGTIQNGVHEIYPYYRLGIDWNTVYPKFSVFYEASAFSTASSNDIPIKSVALKKRPLFLSSTKAGTAVPGIQFSSGFGTFGPPRSVQHQPAKYKLMPKKQALTSY